MTALMCGTDNAGVVGFGSGGFLLVFDGDDCLIRRERDLRSLAREGLSPLVLVANRRFGGVRAVVFLARWKLRRLLMLLAALCLFVAACGSTGELGVEIEVLGPEPGAASEFTATGEAVDQGVVCGSGNAQWIGTFYADTGEPETGAPPDGSVLWVDYEFTCEGGSFVLRSEAAVDNAMVEAGLESGEPMEGGSFSVLSGTGEFEGLAAEGTRMMQFLTAGGVRDVFTGEVDNS